MFKQNLTPETLGERLRRTRDRGYATVSPARVIPNTGKKNCPRTPDTVATRSFTKSPDFEVHASSRAQRQPSTDGSNQNPETPSPIDQSRRLRSRATVESTRLSHSRAGRIQATPRHRERVQGRVDDDLDDVNDSAKCYICLRHLDATNRHTCRGHTRRGCSRAICSNCFDISRRILPEDKFSQRVDEAAGEAASPSPGVSIQSESYRPPTRPVRYQYDLCEKTLATRCCKSCNINLCRICLIIHPTQHPIRELHTVLPTSAGQPSGYMLGEVCESEAVPDDSLNWSKLRQGQGRTKLKSQQGHLSQLSVMLEKLPEQPLLAKLREQPGATTLTLNREHVIGAVMCIQASRRKLLLIGRAKGGPQQDDALQSAKRSVAESAGGSDISMPNSTSSDSHNSDDEEPAADRELHAKRGVMRNLLEFDLPRSKPKGDDKIRRLRWTRKDIQWLQKLKARRWDNADIASKLNRTQAAISQQWAKRQKD